MDNGGENTLVYVLFGLIMTCRRRAELWIRDIHETAIECLYCMIDIKLVVSTVIPVQVSVRIVYV